MSTSLSDHTIDALIDAIEIPDSAYESAARRYNDLAVWLGRTESQSARFSPHVYPQGSFRLGTVVRPLQDGDDYDLDLGCRLRSGITKQSHTQKQLKHMLGADLAEYRSARQIKERLEEKRRCWRLKYADDLKFHMDVVPSIPDSPESKLAMREAIARAGTPPSVAAAVAIHSGSITDNQLASYAVISPDWRVSNSEGFALWFESRMRLASGLLETRAAAVKAAKIDELPAYQWKTPLQRCIQLLKRHRDVMFAENPDGKPISAIITTLAARAYSGESETRQAVQRVLSTIGSLVRETAPRVPNPVNPAEDFADKWGDPKYGHLRLEQNFWAWLARARRDFGAIETIGSTQLLSEHLRKGFDVTVDPAKIAKGLGGRSGGALLKPAAVAVPLSFPPKPVIPSKPAGFA